VAKHPVRGGNGRNSAHFLFCAFWRIANFFDVMIFNLSKFASRRSSQRRAERLTVVAALLSGKIRRQ
jgi:hypothetical protein